MKIEQIEDIISVSYNIAEICRKIYGYDNGTARKKIKKIIKDNNINTSHFDPHKVFRDRSTYKHIKKICPVCEKEFETRIKKDGSESKEERTTCSHACANTYFRTGVSNGSYKKGSKSYRTKCFTYHKKECIICGEDKIVSVHHYDENHENHSIENLIPLCPTHHTYWHSKYKHLIEDKVIVYQQQFLLEYNKQV